MARLPCILCTIRLSFHLVQRMPLVNRETCVILFQLGCHAKGIVFLIGEDCRATILSLLCHCFISGFFAFDDLRSVLQSAGIIAVEIPIGTHPGV